MSFICRAAEATIWFQYEVWIGQQNTTTRLWAMKGSRPRAVKQQQFKYAYMFGAVCPATGETEALIAPHVTKEIMTRHLEQISVKTATGRHAVIIIIMDGEGWHQASLAENISNISIIKLPAYSLEFNPIEQVWSWLRQHHLAAMTILLMHVQQRGMILLMTLSALCKCVIVTG